MKSVFQKLLNLFILLYKVVRLSVLKLKISITTEPILFYSYLSCDGFRLFYFKSWDGIRLFYFQSWEGFRLFFLSPLNTEPLDARDVATRIQLKNQYQELLVFLQYFCVYYVCSLNTTTKTCFVSAANLRTFELSVLPKSYYNLNCLGS